MIDRMFETMSVGEPLGVLLAKAAHALGTSSIETARLHANHEAHRNKHLLKSTHARGVVSVVRANTHCPPITNAHGSTE